MKKMILFCMAMLLFSLLNAQQTSHQLWGMAYGGGNGYGTIFSYDIQQGTIQPVFAFPQIVPGMQGQFPYGARPELTRFTQASDGKLYGVVTVGGEDSYGVLISYDPSSNTLVKLHDFMEATDGGAPRGWVTEAPDGKLYGLTYNGGETSFGTLYAWDPAAASFSVILQLDNTLNGSQTIQGMTDAGSGIFYGHCNRGGSAGWGTLFRFEPATGSFTILHSFEDSAPDHMGKQPQGSPILHPNGKIYGVAEGGDFYNSVTNIRYGIVYAYNPANATYSKVWDFSLIDGTSPAGLTLHPNGKFYGITQYGGLYHNGTLFEFDPATEMVTPVISFNDPVCAQHITLTLGSNNHLYGTLAGGDTGYGLLFEFDPYTWELIPLASFSASDGTGAWDMIEVEVSQTIHVSTTAVSLTNPNDTTVSVELTSNVTWDVSVSDPWITVDPMTGSGSATLFVTVTENTTGGSRTGTIVISTASRSQVTITVTQAGEQGISDEGKPVIHLFPNPCRDKFSLTLPEEGHVTLFSSTGIMMDRIEGKRGTQVVHIPSYPSGVYCVLIQTANGSSLRRLVVQ